MNLDGIKNLATKYYKFILKYEEIIPRVEPILCSKLSKRDLEQYEYIKNKQKHKFAPWRYLSNELSKETIMNLFLESKKELLNFVIAEDGLHEQITTFGYVELENYYKNKGIHKEPEDVSEEIERYRFSNLLNKDIFSKEFNELITLHKELHSLVSRVYNLYQARSTRIMSHKEAKRLGEIFLNFIFAYDKEMKERVKNYTSKLSSDEKMIFNEINDFFYEEYAPWRFLPKGHELDYITEIFEFDFRESIRYCRIYEAFSDEYTFTGVDELEAFYKAKGVFKTDEELFEEMVNYEKSGKLDKTIFSKGVIENFDNMMKLKPIYDALEKIQMSNYSKETKDLDLDITDSM